MEVTAPKREISPEAIKYAIYAVSGLALGGTLSLAYALSGGSTWIHEVLGHGWLGGHLTRTYTAVTQPIYHIRSFANLHKILKASSLGEVLKRIRQWAVTELSGGVAGWAKVKKGTPNALGKLLGDSGIEAWTSISGSLPSLVLNTALIAGGVRMKKRKPLLAFACIGFAVFMQVAEPISYSWTALVQGGFTNAKVSHDYIAFAKHLSAVTGLSPQVIALTTAIGMTTWLPIVGILTELSQRAQLETIISDHEALIELDRQAKTNTKLKKMLEKAVAKYPELDALRAATASYRSKEGGQPLPQKLVHQSLLLESYLIAELPDSFVKSAKRSCLYQWFNEDRESSMSSTGFAMGGVGTTVAARVAEILSTTAFPQIASATSALQMASPALQGIAIAQATRTAIRDWRSDSSRVPTSAKVMSCAKVALLVGASATLFLRLRFSFYLAAAGLGIAAPILLDYARARSLRRAYPDSSTMPIWAESYASQELATV